MGNVKIIVALRANAIQNGEIIYELKYYAEVENGTFGSPKLKNR